MYVLYNRTEHPSRAATGLLADRTELIYYVGPPLGHSTMFKVQERFSFSRYDNTPPCALSTHAHALEESSNNFACDACRVQVCRFATRLNLNLSLA